MMKKGHHMRRKDALRETAKKKECTVTDIDHKGNLKKRYVLTSSIIYKRAMMLK